MQSVTTQELLDRLEYKMAQAAERIKANRENDALTVMETGRYAAYSEIVWLIQTDGYEAKPWSGWVI